MRHLTTEEKIKMYEWIKSDLKTNPIFPYICSSIYNYLCKHHEKPSNVFISHLLEHQSEKSRLWIEYFPEFAKHKPTNMLFGNVWFDNNEQRIKTIDKIIKKLSHDKRRKT